MSSILTNEGASIALQTLRAINSELATTQNEISTGKRVARAGDNSAMWAISKVMESDVASFKRVSDSLSLGQSTISVARQASETVTDLLTQNKGKVVAAQESNVDRSKIQSDIGAMRDQIDAVVQMAQFNGLALLQNKDTTAGSGSTSILASMNRTSEGVTSSDITIRKRDLSTSAAVIASTGGTYTAAAGTATVDASQTDSIDTSALAVSAGTAFSLSLFGTDADESTFVQADYRTSALAAPTQGEMATSDLSYVARDGDTMSDVVTALGRKWDAFASANDIDSEVLDIAFSGTDITLSSTQSSASDQITVTLSRLDADAGNTIGGGLDLLADLDVSTDNGATEALGRIDSLLDIGIETSAAYGSDQNRLETQQDFILSLSDSLKSGIGTLVDTDMEEASARLQALQVQQQLATQALSIANQSPRTLLSLF